MGKRSRPNAKGRDESAVGRSGWMLMMRRSLWLGTRISALTTVERALIWELISLHTGKNNGALFLSVNDAAHRIGVADNHTAAKGFKGLIELGLITVTVDAVFKVRVANASKARAFRLSWIGDDGLMLPDEALPPLDYSQLSAERRKRIERRSKALKAYVRDRSEGKFAVGNFHTLDPLTARLPESRANSGGDVVGNFHTTIPENGSIPSFRGDGDFHIHLVYHGGRGSTGNRCPQCLNTFPQNRAAQTYCSEGCRKKAENKRRYGRGRPSWWAKVEPICLRAVA